MPIPISPPRIRAAIAITVAFAAVLSFSVPARASVSVDLRVIGPQGQTLSDHVQYTDTTKIKTDPKADCFGEGTEGSGKRVKVKGPTPIGAVADGAGVVRDLRPLSVTDAFDFSLGVCGIGGFDFAPTDTAFWYYKVNHTNPQVGAETVKLKRRDEVLWYLTPDFNTLPTELDLVAPARTTSETPTPVQVFEYADDGTKTPAAGVEVTGASEPTDANGETSVSVNAASETLRATRDGAISDDEQICARAQLDDCPKKAEAFYAGSGGDDVIKDGDGADGIGAGAGDDEVDTRDGFSDEVDCGRGKDVVTVDETDEIAKNCEKVRR
jgi:hypothetical protein